MSNAYPGFTLAEHVALGNKLKELRKAAWRPREAFPKASRPSQAAWRLEQAIDKLRSVLDDDVCRLVSQERDPRNLAIKVYYGNQFVPQPSTDTNDAFAEWAQEESPR